MARTRKTGLIQVYTGDGKGKTTAAFGLALRAAGSGMRVYIMQFMKNGPYGEVRSMAQIKNVTVEQCGRRCLVKGTPTRKDIACAVAGFEKCIHAMKSARYDVMILDEINIAMRIGLISSRDIIRLIDDKPAHVELVLTGRHCPRTVMTRAHLITVMKNARHPYDSGTLARRGIEH